jgi:predicted lipase
MMAELIDLLIAVARHSNPDHNRMTNNHSTFKSGENLWINGLIDLAFVR